MPKRSRLRLLPLSMLFTRSQVFFAARLGRDIVRAVTEHGYTQPTLIKTQAIPAALAGA